MGTLPKTGLVFMSIALAFAANPDKGFRPGAPDQYAHQANDGVTIGARRFDTMDATKPVFGKKADLNRYGVLPVLLVIQNDRKQSLDLQNLEVKLEAADSHSIIPLTASEVPFIAVPVNQPTMGPKSPLSRRHKNPLNVPEITTLAFAAKMLPAGDKASGFFYFRAASEPGMRLYVSGVYERPSGKELLYFEIPL
jgi:hypothetical protein